MQVSGVNGYLALKQLALQTQVSVKVLKQANEVVKEQMQELLDLLPDVNIGKNINVRA
ncbi:hypothetical protein TST_0588 [Thermosulfidibacter takaii ABI70S6]|uniref:Motility protein n=1 Tax=Thermosulfidibacter takaii (strain DSM 17441 / JCM 13301 / NBRC 103674 / ABI70S6) TaxID=1298851 RepID=A0A0S3QSR7_THET7|nr:YjfB family protein [Thermosulfidibacter takaii]BAT71394.1 hypothetical protein TST_0588 [Thermosulfidibacter takaii ABI70S6]